MLSETDTAYLQHFFLGLHYPQIFNDISKPLILSKKSWKFPCSCIKKTKCDRLGIMQQHLYNTLGNMSSQWGKWKTMSRAWILWLWKTKKSQTKRNKESLGQKHGLRELLSSTAILLWITATLQLHFTPSTNYSLQNNHSAIAVPHSLVFILFLDNHNKSSQVHLVVDVTQALAECMKWRFSSNFSRNLLGAALYISSIICIMWCNKNNKKSHKTQQ